MSINKRLSEVRNYLDLSQKKFADSIGVSVQTIQNLEKEKYNVSGEVLTKVLTVYPGVDARWLVIGEGEMFRNDGKYTLNLNGKQNISTFITDETTTARDSKAYYHSANNKKIKALQSELTKTREENTRLKQELDNAKDRIIALQDKLL